MVDYAGTDVFGELGPVSFSASLNLIGFEVVSATFEALVWGLDLFATSPANGGTFGDENEGAVFSANGSPLGTYHSLNSLDGNGPDRVELVSFSVDPTLLVSGVNTFTITPEDDFLPFASAFFTGLDAFAIDYARLSLETREIVAPPVSEVPLPAGLPLLLSGFIALGWMRRSRG
ncbi:hypothetical protein GCM10022404_04800 [Celeribacter arenosi]|uniref:VPLPA-CTERM protein sorting domain-containing protein n=1 Tax=Celeribacter arenosi TaxID=792649 RepID=A0ABP7JW49_9RHOB